MAVSLLIAGLLTQASNFTHYTLSLFEGNFVLRRGSDVVRVPVIAPVPKPRLVVLYRRDRNYAVWDDRGLTVRAGRYVRTTRLSDVSMTPKLFSRDEILRNASLMHRGVRRREADSLSGSKRVGTNAYFLARWTEPTGQPWLEALVSVDMASRHPEPVLVGRFEGFSAARQKIDDRMVLAGRNLGIATQREHDWGVASFSPESSEFQFRSVGDKLVNAYPGGLFTEKTGYGNVLGGKLDWAEGSVSRLFEDSGSDLHWLDDGAPAFAVTRSPSGRVLRDCDTGAELPISQEATARRAGRLVIVWSPAKAPKHAYAYEPSDWKRVAEWHAGS